MDNMLNKYVKFRNPSVKCKRSYPPLIFAWISKCLKASKNDGRAVYATNQSRTSKSRNYILTKSSPRASAIACYSTLRKYLVQRPG